MGEAFNHYIFAHELGHAFGVRHNFNNEAYMIGYGRGAMVLAPESASSLSVHPYFNSQVSLGGENPPAIEYNGPTIYEGNPLAIPLQFNASDKEGIHQVILYASSPLDSRQTFAYLKSPQLIDCKVFPIGVRDTVVTFHYTGEFPHNTSTDLALPEKRVIWASAIDTDGNIVYTSFTLKKAPPLVPVGVLSRIEASAQIKGNGVAFSSGGDKFVTVGEDGSFRFYSSKSLSYIGNVKMRGFTKDSITSFLFARNDTRLITAGNKGHAQIDMWDATTLKHIATIARRGTWYPYAFNSVAYSPVGSILAWGSYSGEVFLWDMVTQKTLLKISGYRGVIQALSFSPDGNLLAIGNSLGDVSIWDIEAEKPIITWAGHDASVSSVRFLGGGKKLATASFHTKVWDTQTWEQVSVLKTRGVFSPEGDFLASHDRLWDVEKREIVATYKNGYVSPQAFSSDGQRLVVLENPEEQLLSWIDTSSYIPLHAPIVVLPPEPPSPDFNGDGIVGAADFALFARHWGRKLGDNGWDAKYDLDGDGVIGQGDFDIFAKAWGT